MLGREVDTAPGCCKTCKIVNNTLHLRSRDVAICFLLLPGLLRGLDELAESQVSQIFQNIPDADVLSGYALFDAIKSGVDGLGLQNKDAEEICRQMFTNIKVRYSK